MPNSTVLSARHITHHNPPHNNRAGEKGNDALIFSRIPWLDLGKGISGKRRTNTTCSAHHLSQPITQ